MHEALNTPDGLRALAEHDVTTIYRLLNEAGVSQRDIALMTGQGQSEVSEVIKGRRKVIAYDVLVKIAVGLEIPRGLLGLAYDEDLLGEEMDEEMKRRALLAVGSVTLFDRPILGELLQIPTCPEVPTPLPKRLGRSDITALEVLTAELRAWSQRWGGGAGTISGIAERSERLLGVTASESVRKALITTLAKLHTVAAWAAFDERLDDLATNHFAQAMTFAGMAKEPYWLAFGFYGGGRIVSEQGHPNDALKYYQMAQYALPGDKGRHARAPILDGYLHSESALEYAAMGHHLALSELSKATDGPIDADSYNIAAETHLRLGNLDTAHEMASCAVRDWQGSPNRRHAVMSDVLLAKINVRAGEPRAALLVRHAIQSVAGMQSRLAGVRLERLASELDMRSSPENRELAVMARRVAGQRSS